MATYHGIHRAACPACRYDTRDDITLEILNDAPSANPGQCPRCFGPVLLWWVETDDGMQVRMTYNHGDARAVGIVLSFDDVEELGYDGTLRDM